MELETLRDDGTLIAQPNGRIDGLANATELQKALERAIRPTDHALILDMANLSYLSSAGLRTVAIMINRTKAADMSFVVCSLSTPLRGLFAASGFDKLVPVVDTLEDARGAVRA